MPSIALYPISLGNRIFSKPRVISSLTPLSREYEHIIIWLVDKITIYNKAKNINNNNELSNLFKSKTNDMIYNQAVKFLDKIIKKNRFKNSSAKFTIHKTDDFVTSKSLHIYRKLIILECLNEEFSQDIKQVSSKYYKNQGIDNPSEKLFTLSKHYILEEIAININLRLSKIILSEYYLGEQLVPFVKLYSATYGISIEDLYGEPNSYQFNFYQYSEDLEEWELIEIA